MSLLDKVASKITNNPITSAISEASKTSDGLQSNASYLPDIVFGGSGEPARSCDFFWFILHDPGYNIGQYKAYERQVAGSGTFDFATYYGDFANLNTYLYLFSHTEKIDVSPYEYELDRYNLGSFHFSLPSTNKIGTITATYIDDSAGLNYIFHKMWMDQFSEWNVGNYIPPEQHSVNFSVSNEGPIERGLTFTEIALNCGTGFLVSRLNEDAFPLEESPNVDTNIFIPPSVPFVASDKQGLADVLGLMNNGVGPLEGVDVTPNSFDSGLESVKNLVKSPLPYLTGLTSTAAFVAKAIGNSTVNLAKLTNVFEATPRFYGVTQEIYPRIFPIKIQRTPFSREGVEFAKITVTYIRIPIVNLFVDDNTWDPKTKSSGPGLTDREVSVKNVVHKNDPTSATVWGQSSGNVSRMSTNEILKPDGSSYEPKKFVPISGWTEAQKAVAGNRVF